MEELIRYEKQLDKSIEEETKRLLSLGYTQQEIDILDEAIECICYPIITEYYEHPDTFENEE